MGGPWEKYASQSPDESGPWTKYGSTQAPNAGLAGPSTPDLAFGSSSAPKAQMQESSVPKLVRSMMGTLPAVGGLVGGIAGAGASGGVGAVAGGALGAAAGESANLGLRNAVFDNPKQGVNETSPISKEGLKDTAIAGGLGAASEIPAMALLGTGNRLMSRIAAARGTKQTGDVIAGLQDLSPASAGPQGIMNTLNVASSKEAQALRSTLSSSQTPINIDGVVVSARQAAADAVTNSGGVLKAVPKQLEIAIEAAKQRAGITGATATPQQLFDFMQELRAFKGDPGKAAGVVQDLAKQIYREGGAQLRTAAPGTDEILSRLTNYHAVKDAISNYGIGRAGAVAITAATHPMTTAAVSPALAAATPLAFDKARRHVGNLAAELTK